MLGGGSPPGRFRSDLPAADVTVEDHAQARFTYRIHPVRNLDPESLPVHPVTAVFAPLGRASARQRVALLRRAVEAIATSAEPAFERRRLLECLAVLAALRIDSRPIIRTTIEETAVPIDLTQSSIVRHYMDEARIRGMLELRFGADGAAATDETIAHLAAQADPAALISAAESLDQLRP